MFASKSAKVLLVASVLMYPACADRGADPPPPPVIPAITGVFPETLQVHTVAEIRGSGFEGYQQSYTVVFPGAIPSTTYLSWDDTVIRCIVPSSAITGMLQVRKGDVASNEFAVLVAGTQSDRLMPSQTSVSTNTGQSTNITVSGGVGPYTIQTAPSPAIASASMLGSALTIRGISAGTTSVVIADASLPALTATISIRVTTPQSVVSFSQQIIPIFTTSCMSCHGGTANLFLTASQAYTNLVNVTAQTGSCAGLARVAPGNSAQSALYRRVSGTCSDRMPLGGSLGQAEINLIRDWIDQGAQNN